MTARHRAARIAFAVLSLLLLSGPLAPALPQVHAAPAALADPAFERVWNHCDKPVQAGVAVRSWMWGPASFHTTYEPYAEGPGGQHLVSYFDKSRMEINNPNGDRTSAWFVTNGLLVVDLITGRVQTGNQTFTPAAPAQIPVAGDTATSANAPTYAALAPVASLAGDHRAPNRVGQAIAESLGRWGTVGQVTPLAGYSRYAVYESNLGHNIADVFWQFMNQKGTTYHDSGYLPNDTVVDWLFAMGYPLTEPYWIQIRVGGTDHWVLMQAFQRRILTYAPDNPPGWQVEMGNVGRAYFDWRYGPPPVVPTPTPVPTPVAHITLNPSAGGVATPITVRGQAFPPHAAVLIAVEKPAANYFRTLTTVAAQADGTFQTQITLPDDAAAPGEVTISATANGGAIRATQAYRITYAPSIQVAPSEVVPNGTIHVQGTGFPANTAVHVGLVFARSGATTWLEWARTNAGGTFDTRLSIGHQPVGAQFTAIAVTDGGVKAASAQRVTVIAQPAVQVTPDRGPAGVHVTFRGSNWPPNRLIGIGYHGGTSQVAIWLANGIVTDGTGSFSLPVWIGPEFASYSEVHLVATEASSQIRLESTYYVVWPPAPTPVPPTPTPLPPRNPTLVVAPQVLTAGQAATVSGSDWPVGATVALGLGRSGVEEWLGTIVADATGHLARPITISPRWANAGQLILTAVVANGPSATTTVWIGLSGGRIVPAGLPLTVLSLGGTNTPASLRAQGAGWAAGKAVTVSVFAADGTVDVVVATATVAGDGTFQAGWTAAAPWWGRPDLGVRAVTSDGEQASIRYLPWTQMSKTNTGGTYLLQGANWPSNTRLQALLHVAGEDEEGIGQVTTDASGAFTLTVAVPRVPASTRNHVEVRSLDGVYSAVFGF